jgi:hypothetical protein
MSSFLEPLLHDLAERFRFLDEELASIQAPSEAGPCRQQIQRLVSRGKARIDSVLTDPDIARPDFAKNFYHTFKRLSELAQAVEEGPLFALSRFRLEDRFLTRVVGAVCQEFAFPYTAPVCAAMSSQYYFAMPGMDLILVPHGEATHLLGWADLYHELGHFILARNRAGLLQPLRRRVSNHFLSAVHDATRQGWAPDAIEELNTYRGLWLGDWILEFACDWFATFAAGPSFARSNLRLCARMSTDLFGIAPTHPADAARTRAIIEMLKLIAGHASTHQVESQWKELQGTVGTQEPQRFRIAYPPVLIHELATEANQLFRSSGFHSYNPGSRPIADLLTEAWNHFQADPAGFPQWERGQLQQLKKDVNLI